MTRSGGRREATITRHDSEISWFDWDLLERHAGLHRFVKSLITARLQFYVATDVPGLTLNQLLQQAHIQWHGVKLNQPDWGADSHAIAMTATSLRGRFMIHLMMNAYWEDLEFEVPSVAVSPGQNWKRWIDTFRESPEDICSWDDAAVVREAIYKVRSRSLVVLVARLENHGKL